MNNSFEIPFYGKTALIFISAVAFGLILFVGQHIIIPILYATMVAILLNPLVNFLLDRKVNKILSISVAVILAILILLCFAYVVSAQLTLFTETYPQLKEKFITTSTRLLQ